MMNVGAGSLSRLVAHMPFLPELTQSRGPVWGLPTQPPSGQPQAVES